MKNFLAPVATFILFTSVIVLNSCKSREEDPTVGFSEEIQKFVPQSIVNDLRSKGMTINEGKVPPNVEGAFRVAPMELISPYSSQDNYVKGKIISPYRYQFSGQGTDNKTVKIDYKSESGTDKAVGIGSYVAGNANKFCADR
jgi:hypothetical protein